MYTISFFFKCVVIVVPACSTTLALKQFTHYQAYTLKQATSIYYPKTEASGCFRLTCRGV